jgi:hypothetical protein
MEVQCGRLGNIFVYQRDARSIAHCHLDRLGRELVIAFDTIDSLAAILDSEQCHGSRRDCRDIGMRKRSESRRYRVNCPCYGCCCICARLRWCLTLWTGCLRWQCRPLYLGVPSVVLLGTGCNAEVQKLDAEYFSLHNHPGYIQETVKGLYWLDGKLGLWMLRPRLKRLESSDSVGSYEALRR